MQLKNHPASSGNSAGAVSASIAAATASLLGHALPGTAIAQELTPWEFDTAVLYYGESGGRVRDFSINLLANKEIREERNLSLKLALDTLTGATPSGAAPANVVQTFTSPSGSRGDTIAPGALPLDSSFKDTRVAIGVNYEIPLRRLLLFNVGLSLSDEYDYTHTGVNMKLARDFNNRNTTLSFGLAFATDSIDPVGGAPIPLSPMTGDVEDEDEDESGIFRRASESKDVTDFLIGVTQVLNRRTIVQFNYSLSNSDGYLTDPYKILSIVDPVLGTPVAALPDSEVDYLYRYEKRPATRDKQSIYALLKRDMNGNVFDVSYRYMTDDWDIDSHTIDLHYRFNLERGSYLQPHIRFYSQTAANFYNTVLFDGSPLPMFATADYRLGEFDAITVGIKFGKPTQRGEWSGRLELYQQTSNPSPSSRVGSLSNLDLTPDLNAIIAQFSYNFGG